MKQKRLTAVMVAKVKANASRRVEYPDGGTGLYLVVQPSGAKSWAYRYVRRQDGVRRKMTLGPVLTLQEGEAEPPAALGQPLTLRGAREVALGQQRLVQLGKDPAGLWQEQRRARRSKGDRFGEVLGEFYEMYVRVHNRASTAKETERLLNAKALPAWKGRPVGEISRKDVRDLLDRTVEKGARISANRLLAALRKFFNWCVERDLIVASPCVGVKPPSPETSRERVLSDSEIALVWQATEAIGQPFGPFIRMLLLTGQRRQEVAKMRTSEVDADKKMWTLSGVRTKNGDLHAVPLSPLAIETLASVIRPPGKPDYIFTTGPSPKSSPGDPSPPLVPVSGFSRAKSRLDAAILVEQRRLALENGEDPSGIEAVPPWSFHDLRRTFTSGLAALGVPLPVAETAINHRSGALAGVVRTYQRYNYAAERRDAFERWAAHVQAIVATPSGGQ